MAKGDRTREDGPYMTRGAEDATEGPPGFVEAGQVTARERLLVSLVDSGMSGRDVASVLGLASARSVKTMVRRARRKLEAHARNYALTCDFLDQTVVPLAGLRLHGMVQAGVPEAVFKTLSGRGVLRDHKMLDGGGEAKGGVPQLTVVFQQTVNAPTVAAGAIVGAPRPALDEGRMGDALPVRATTAVDVREPA